MRVTDAVAATLAGLGADTVFGVVGSGNFHVTNALISQGARFVAARHEGGAACMADGWARTAGRTGLLSVHQGPGLTNALTGITEAAKSRTPLRGARRGLAAAAVQSNFRIDVAALAAAVGAVPERLHSPASAVADTARAYRTAAGQRRTVILALPLDVQAGECDRQPPAAGPVLGPVAPRRRRGGRPGRPARPGQAAGVRGRAGRPGRTGRAGPGAAGRRLRRAAGHLGRGPGPVPRQPVGPGRERRLRHPARRRADQRGRPDRRLGLRAEHVDHAARHPDRAGGHRRPGRRRPGRDRRAPAGPPGRARRRGGDRPGGAGRAGRPVRQRSGLPHRRGPGRGSPARPGGATCRTPTRAGTA